MTNRTRPSIVFATAAILLAVAAAWWTVAAFVYAFHWFATAIMGEVFPESASRYGLWVVLCGVAAFLGVLGARLWWREQVGGALACTVGSALVLFGLPSLLSL